MAVVHQLVNSFQRGEPATESALQLLVLLRRLGHWGELLSVSPPGDAAPLVRHLDAVRFRKKDWVLGHHAGASALTARLLLLGCQRAMVLDAHPPGDVGSRAHLAALSSATAFALAPSSAAARLLSVSGYTQVMRYAPFVEAERFTEGRAEAALLRALRRAQPGQIRAAVAGGTPDEVWALFEELRRLQPAAEVLVSRPRQWTNDEYRTLMRRTAWFRGFRLHSTASHAQRVALLRSATVFVSLDEEDLLGTSLLDAMAAGVPVLAYGAASARGVLAGAGLAFTEKRFAFLAELAMRMTQDEGLRGRILAGQRARLASASPARAETSLKKALSPFIATPDAPSRSRRRPRVAVVVQRYGPVTGGAEALARSIVQRMFHRWDITVLTSCAKDHLTWANVFPPGATHVDGVRVLRFPTRVSREMRSLNARSRRVFGKSLDRGEEESWVAAQGPLSPGLWRHLAEEGQDYDGVLAFTYLYASTAWSVPLMGEKTIVVPTTHDEPPLAFGVYQDVFERPSVLLASTPEERRLISTRFARAARTRLVGAGVEPPAFVNPPRFRRRFRISRPYLLYVGRVEAGKGIPELLKFFAALREAELDAPDLLLAGDASMPVSGVGIHALGRISERDKWDALAGAVAVVVPSTLESLSLLALEAFAVGTPVVGNGAGDVVRGQLERSGGGQAYRDVSSFRKAVNAVSRARAAFGKRGRAYARQHSWNNVVEAYREEMNRIARRG